MMTYLQLLTIVVVLFSVQASATIHCVSITNYNEAHYALVVSKRLEHKTMPNKDLVVAGNQIEINEFMDDVKSHVSTKLQSTIKRNKYDSLLSVIPTNICAKLFILPDGYKDYQQIVDTLKNYANEYPQLCAMVDSSLYGGKTYEGRAIPIIKISDNVNKNEDEPRILINSEHHAREIVTPQIALFIIDRLLSNYSTNATIAQLVDSNEIFIAPMWNPDGYNYVFTVYNFWRKNRFPNGDGSYGVDQNRNYNYNWGTCSMSKSPSSDIYAGPRVNSELETQTMVAFSIQNNIAKLLDFHSYGREVLYGGDCKKYAKEVQQFQATESEKLAQLADYIHRLPSADAEHQQFHIQNVSSYAFLVETATSFQPSFEAANEEAERVWPLVVAFLQRDIPLYGHVIDSVTSDALNATIIVENVHGIQRQSVASNFGRYHLFLPAGSYNVIFSSPGYKNSTVAAVISDKPSTLLDVKLQK